MAQKLLAVVGATGAQGGGLARAALADPARRFRVRALTRTPASDAARALAALGAEVVAADLDDAPALRRAFDGADAAFCVTNFWEHYSGERELAQAAALAAAADAARVRHVVWSTLEDTRRWVPLDDRRMPTLQGRFKVPHFDAKGEADRLFTGRGLPVTFFRTSFYWENLVGFGAEPRRGADGVLTLALPMGDKALPGIAAEDIGKCAYGVFLRPERYVGATVGVAGEHLTGAEMAAALSDALGETVRYHAIPPDDYRALGFPGADELGNMFQFKRDANDAYRAARSVEESRALNPDLRTFRAWLAEHAARIPVEPPLAVA